MQHETEKRSRTSGTPGPDEPRQRVGGRQDGTGLAVEGGGYQDICSQKECAVGAQKNRARDPRLDELAAAGLGQHWQDIAELVGYDQWMQVWGILLAASLDERGRICVPHPTRLVQQQRHALIHAMVADGHDLTSIQRVVLQKYRQTISIRQLRRITK